MHAVDPHLPPQPSKAGVTMRLGVRVASRVRVLAEECSVSTSDAASWLIELGLAHYQGQNAYAARLVELIHSTHALAICQRGTDQPVTNLAPEEPLM